MTGTTETLQVKWGGGVHLTPHALLPINIWRAAGSDASTISRRNVAFQACIPQRIGSSSKLDELILIKLFSFLLIFFRWICMWGLQYLKWSGSFFKTITKVLYGISGITNNIIFFHLKACERRHFDFCVFLRMCSGSRCHWRACGAWSMRKLAAEGPTSSPSIQLI